jgi:hypothetical protein
MNEITCEKSKRMPEEVDERNIEAKRDQLPLKIADFQRYLDFGVQCDLCESKRATHLLPTGTDEAPPGYCSGLWFLCPDCFRIHEDLKKRARADIAFVAALVESS